MKMTMSFVMYDGFIDVAKHMIFLAYNETILHVAIYTAHTKSQ